MQRIWKLCLVILLAFSCAACGESDDGDISPSSPSPIPSTPSSSFDEELMWLRQSMIDTPYLAAVGYLGLFEGEYDDLSDYLASIGITETYPFLDDISEEEYIDLEGEQIYCIVPKDEDAAVYVYEWIIDEFNDYMGEPGNILYSSDEGQPIFVKGNVSEYMPNMMIEIIEADGTSLSYVPMLSGMDGSLITPVEQPWVVDITPYEFFEIEYGYSYDFDEAQLTRYEAWNTFAFTEEGEYLTASFTFYEDSTVEFCYGPEGEPYQYYYEGYFTKATYAEYPENTYELELYLVDDYSEMQDGEDIRCAMTITSYPDSNELIICFVYGDPFGYEDNEGVYYFSPSVG